jgi:hypothetical protein
MQQYPTVDKYLKAAQLGQTPVETVQPTSIQISGETLLGLSYPVV